MYDKNGTQLGYIWLQPGVSRLDGWTLLYVLFISIGLLVFLNFQQPYVLEVMLGIPESEHGRVIAKMGLVHEIVILSLVGPFGALSDRIGRRPVLAFGYLMITAGYMAYPFATSVLMLTAFRAIFAVGAAAVICTFTTVLTDYPQELSRGKLVALGSVLNGFGLAILAFIVSDLFRWIVPEMAAFRERSPKAYRNTMITAFVLIAVILGLTVSVKAPIAMILVMEADQVEGVE